MTNNKLRLQLFAVKTKRGHLLKSDYSMFEYVLSTIKSNLVPHQKSNEGSKIVKVTVTIEENL